MTFASFEIDIPRRIECCSQLTRLEPGDVVEVEIDEVGLPRNGIADQA